MSPPIRPRRARRHGRRVWVSRRGLLFGGPALFGLGVMVGVGAQAALGPSDRPRVVMEPASASARTESSAPEARASEASASEASASEATASGASAPEATASEASASEATKASASEARASGASAVSAPSATGLAPSGPNLAPGSAEVGTSSAAPLRFERASPSRGYGLQVAAFPSEAEAEAYLGRHRDALPTPRFLVEQTVKGERWFRVRVGQFSSMAAAREARRELPDGVGSGAMVVRYR